MYPPGSYRFSNLEVCPAEGLAQSLGGSIHGIYAAARRRSAPRPETTGLGSLQANTTRSIPAAMMASVQGGVRLPGPEWQQGSSVQ